MLNYLTAVCASVNRSMIDNMRLITKPLLLSRPRQQEGGCSHSKEAALILRTVTMAVFSDILLTDADQI